MRLTVGINANNSALEMYNAMNEVRGLENIMEQLTYMQGLNTNSEFLRLDIANLKEYHTQLNEEEVTETFLTILKINRVAIVEAIQSSIK